MTASGPTLSTTLSESDARAYSANINRFYLFRFFVDFQLWLPIWVIYLIDERGLSLTQVTALDAPFWLLLIVMEVPTGAVADRWGRKASLSYGAALNAVAVIVFGLAGNFVLLLFSYMVWAVAWTLFSGADAAFFYDSLRVLGREGEYQKLWGRMRAVQSSGAILGLALGAPLAAITTLWVPVVGSGALILVAWGITLTFREPPRFADGEEQLGYLAGTKQAFRIAFGRPAVRAMLLFAAVVMGIGVSMQILAQPFLASHDVGYGNFGWFLIPGQLLAIGLSLAAYRVTAAIGLSRVIVLMPLLVLTTAVGLGAFDHLGAFAFYPLTTMVFAMSFPVISDYLNRRIPSSSRATILSIYSLLFSLMAAGMEPLLGAVGDAQGLPIAYRTAAIAMAVVGAPLLALWLRENRGEVLANGEAEGTAAEQSTPGESEAEPAARS